MFRYCYCKTRWKILIKKIIFYAVWMPFWFLLMIKASLKFSIISTGVLSQFTLILYGTGSSATDPSISDYTRPSNNSCKTFDTQQICIGKTHHGPKGIKKTHTTLNRQAFIGGDIHDQKEIFTHSVIPLANPLCHIEIFIRLSMTAVVLMNINICLWV